MKRRKVVLSILALTLALASAVNFGWARGLPSSSAASAPLSTTSPLGEAFTYQGRLSDAGGPVTGPCDFTFDLYDQAVGGSLLDTETVDGVEVSDGLFTVLLSFDLDALTGGARWLQIAVDCGDGAATLSPRQALTPAPYALYAPSAGSVPWSGVSLLPGGFADNVDDDTLAAMACAGGQVAKWDGAAWACAEDLVGGSGGSFWALSGNIGTTPGTHYLGTRDNKALELKVNGARALRLEPNSASPNLIGGHSGNAASAGVHGATIGGGGAQHYTNLVSGNYGTVGGGDDNEAGDRATVSGGDGNTAGGKWSFVGGGNGNIARGETSTVAGGVNNVANGYGAVVGGGGELYDEGQGRYVSVPNEASGDLSVVAGGGSNVASGFASVVSGGGAELSRYTGDPDEDIQLPNVASGDLSTISGGGANVASGYASSVGGGGGVHMGRDLYITTPNTAAGNWSTVGGGGSNRATAMGGTVAGGWDNDAIGEGAFVGGGAGNRAAADFATIAGGGGWVEVPLPYSEGNSVYDEGGTIGGGNINLVGSSDGDPWNSRYATVSGGASNTASGAYSTVPGGSDNGAHGDYSFAAGRQAWADNDGCFVWGDNTNRGVTCDVDNRWVARASGGVYFFTNANLSSGVRVNSGGNAWSSASDRNLKEGFEEIDYVALLEQLVAGVPITSWSYKSEDPSIRHAGPVAQDFYAAFGLGEDDGTISTVDADGVALAAIQGLYRLVQDKDAQIADLEARLAALEALVLTLMPAGTGGGQ